MPVQFTCSHCHRRLSVGHRKAGSTVACPKCGCSNVVPGSALSQVDSLTSPAVQSSEPEAGTPKAGEPEVSEPRVNEAEAATAPAVIEPPPAPPDESHALEIAAPAFDDVLQLITGQDTGNPAVAAPPAAVPPVVAVSVGAAAPVAPPPIPPIVESRLPPSTSVAARGPATRRGRHDEGPVLVVSRQAVYAQAALAGGLALLAFLAGLTIGRSSRPAGKADADQARQAAGEPVPLEGYVLYSLSPGHSMADAGAIIIAFPAGKTPARKLAARGLRPADGDDFSSVPAVEDLRTLGGAVARADESGQFQLVVPRPGDFSILIVSRRAKRPHDQTISLADQEELSRVFASPSDLIGQQRYAILSRRLSGAPRPYTHEFETTDKS